jgi:hypothetical protein
MPRPLYFGAERENRPGEAGVPSATATRIRGRMTLDKPVADPAPSRRGFLATGA